MLAVGLPKETLTRRATNMIEAHERTARVRRTVRAQGELRERGGGQGRGD